LVHSEYDTVLLNKEVLSEIMEEEEIKKLVKRQITKAIKEKSIEKDSNLLNHENDIKRYINENFKRAKA